MAIKILQIDLQNDITPQIGSYDNAGGVTPNNWLDEDGVYSLGPTNGQGTTPYYWFTPTREVTDFDLCWEDYQGENQTTPQYHLEIGDSAGNVVFSMFQQYGNYHIGPVNVVTPAYQTWHKMLVEVRKASASSSTVTAYVDGKKVAAGTSATLITSAKIALLGHVPDSYYWQNAGQRVRYVTIYDRSYTSKGINLDGMMTTITALISKLIAKLSTVALTGSYNDLSDKPTISTVNNGTLTIQKNGTNVATFTANQSTNATANITVPTKTSDLTNDSGFITSDNTKIPLAGSNAISGSLIPSTDGTVNLGGSNYQWNNAYIKSLTINGTAAGDILTHNASEFVPRSGGAVMGGSFYRSVDNNYLRIGGGTGFGDGAVIGLHGKNYTGETPPRAGAIYFRADNGSDSRGMLLYPNGTWTWTGTAVQLLSDQRLKQQIAEIDDKLLDAWEDVDLVQFKYNDAVDAKKDKARLHTGYVVQQIDSACKSHGVDISEYGLYCHEVYQEETEEVEVEQADGTKTKERKVIREASEHYSLRYTEALIVECKYLRRCIARLTARIEELEKGKEQEAGK